MSTLYGTYRRRKQGYTRAAEYAERFRRLDARKGWDGHRLRVEQIAHHDHLYYCLLRVQAEGGPAPGIDRIKLPNLSPEEWGVVLRDLAGSILDGSYRSRETYKKPIPKGDTGKVRVLSIGAVFDRVVAKAVANVFAPFWEERFWKHSYGFRRGLGTWDMLAAIDTTMIQTRRTSVLNCDIEKAFDNVPLDAVFAVHADAIGGIVQNKFTATDKNRTMALVETVLRGHDRTRERGIEQGNCYAPFALNALLDVHHDTRLHEITTKPHGLRYADNFAYLLPSVSDGERTLSEVQNLLLNPLGMRFKGEDGVQDLSSGDNTQLLGFNLRWNGEGLTFSPNPESLHDLRKRLGDAQLTPNPACTALTALTGWIDAFAPAIENGDLSEVFHTAITFGYREFSPEQMQERWKAAWERWQMLRNRTQSRLEQR